MTVTHHTGHVLNIVRQLPDASVDLVACSPPFLALRDYNGLADQWGSEPTPAAFLAHLLELTTELRRVLAPHGSIAIELGDTFAGSGGHGGDYAEGGLREGQAKFSGSTKAGRIGRVGQQRDPQGFTGRSSHGAPGGTGWPGAKSLCGTPTLFAWSLAYGRNLLDPAQTIEPWLVRNVIVWARNNPPVGALGDKVRPATSYITVATPSPRRWFDLDAVRTAAQQQGTVPSNGPKSKEREALGIDGAGRYAMRLDSNPAGAPPLDHWHDQPDGDLLWLINTQGSNLSHYAMWPPALAERLILAMCPAQVCRACGEPRRRLTERTPEYAAARAAIGDFKATGERANGLNGTTQYHAGRHIENAENITIGWSDCGHDNYRPGVVLDPFCGTGTTLAVADILGRDAVGIDLDPSNRSLYEARWGQCWRALRPDAGPAPVTAAGVQGQLL